MHTKNVVRVESEWQYQFARVAHVLEASSFITHPQPATIGVQ